MKPPLNGTTTEVGPGGADVLLYGLLFLGSLVVCVLAMVVGRALWYRFGPPSRAPRQPGPEERLRLAVRSLEQAGIDLPAVLGDWSPTHSQPGVGLRRPPQR